MSASMAWSVQSIPVRYAFASPVMSCCRSTFELLVDAIENCPTVVVPREKLPLSNVSCCVPGKVAVAGISKT